MYSSEVKEIFDSFQEVGYHSSYNIGAVCNHFEGAGFRTVRQSGDEPFGFRGDPQYLVLFSKLLMSGHDLEQARKRTGLGRRKATKLIKVLNAASETRGLPPVYVLKTKPRRKSIPITCDQTGEVFPSVYRAAHSMGLNLGNLNNHVNGRRSYRTIKGYTFRKINCA